MAATWTPKFEGKTNAGLPVVLGQLFTYAAGTTTPIATYTDQSGMVQNSNPVQLDAAGRANVWLVPGVFYKFVLRTAPVLGAPGVEVWSVDNFSVADPQALGSYVSLIGGQNGSLSVGYVQAGTGAIPETVQSGLRRGPAFFEQFGALGDDSTSDDLAFEKLFASGARYAELGKADRVYILNNPHQLPVGMRIDNPNGAKIRFTGAAVFYHADRIRLNNLIFQGPSTSHAIATASFDASACSKDVQIISPRCITCMLVRTIPRSGFPANYYSTIDWAGKTNVCQDWLIVDPQGSTATPEDGQSFIDMQYIDGIEVQGGRAAGYVFGFLYWGGDSNFGQNGAAANIRKCDRVKVKGFSTSECTGSGLWGSMAQNARFESCTAIRSTIGGDVGIDHEGTLNAVNVDCVVQNYANGNYASFFGTKHFELRGCKSIQRAGFPHFRNYNDSQQGALGADIQVIGGVYTSSDKNCNNPSFFDDLNGPFNSISFSGGVVFEDSVCNFKANNTGSVIVDGVTLRVSTLTNILTDFFAVFTNASYYKQYSFAHVGIDFNPADTTFDSMSSLIRVVTQSNNTRQDIDIHDCKGRELALRGIESGTNSSISGIFNYHDNVTSQVQMVNSGALPLVNNSHNNYNQNGIAV